MKAKKQAEWYCSKQYFLPDVPCSPMRYAAGNNAIAHIPTDKDRYDIDKFANTWSYKNENITAWLANPDPEYTGAIGPMTGSAKRLLDYLNILLTKNGGKPDLEVSFDAYAEHRGVTGKQARLRLRKQWLADMDILYNLSFEYRGKHGSIKTRLINSVAVSASKDRAKISLVEAFAKYSYGPYFGPYFDMLARIDGRNPNAYDIGRKLWEHWINPKNHADGKRKLTDTYDRLSLISLLAAAPDMPTFAEVREKHNRRYKDFIIIPIIKCLEELKRVGVVKKYEWWNADGKTLTDEDWERADGDAMQGWLLHFTLYTPPAIQ